MKSVTVTRKGPVCRAEARARYPRRRSMSSKPERHRHSLQDLARLARQSSAPSAQDEKEDSGIIDLRVELVFASSGLVDAIHVTGGAAGTPAEKCIETALRKAKVAPFAKTRYATSVTVRAR